MPVNVPLQITRSILVHGEITQMHTIREKQLYSYKRTTQWSSNFFIKHT